MRPHSAVGLVDRLVAAGFVERSRSAADRRRVLVHLTPRGRSSSRSRPSTPSSS
ncbi:MAG: MarR family transcriptional regulator [Thermoanaerobaculia bacterium]